MIDLRVPNANHIDDFIKYQHSRTNEDIKSYWFGETIKEIWYNNEMVGYVAYSKWDNAYCVSCISIKEEYRRKGIGKDTLRKLVYKLSKDCELIYAFVYVDNLDAIEFYKNFGCKFLSKDRYYVISNPCKELCVVDNDQYEFAIWVKKAI